MLKAVLIDDEPSGRTALRVLLADHPDVAIIDEAGSLAAARTVLGGPDYDLVFLDIQLRGGTGFDLVPAVRSGARIIFVTAYDQHALRAFQVNALDYLMKPVAPERLAAALARLATPPSATPPVLTSDDRLLLKLSAGHNRFVRLGDIRCIASEENYSFVTVGAAGERLLVGKTLKAWEELLPPAFFVRVHRQVIVNLAHIERLDRGDGATSWLHLDGVAEPVAVSARSFAALRGRLASGPR